LNEWEDFYEPNDFIFNTKAGDVKAHFTAKMPGILRARKAHAEK
jgi:hypothetical protein